MVSSNSSTFNSTSSSFSLGAVALSSTLTVNGIKHSFVSVRLVYAVMIETEAASQARRAPDLGAARQIGFSSLGRPTHKIRGLAFSAGRSKLRPR